MSLLLTKTCEYAILVSIQQGRHFPVNKNMRIETELDLKLPPSINDLIPTKTTISTQITRVDSQGNIQFNTTLVYFVSFKQLQRLRRNDAKTTIYIKDVKQETTTNLILSISEAKEVIPQSQHKLDHIYKFVSDKGAWFTINEKELKCGLFYVAMPDSSNTTCSSTVLNTPSIQLRSPPSTPIMTTKRLNLSNSNRKKKISSILGTNNSSTTNTSNNKKTEERVPLRRTKSSLVDLNIEELSNVLKKINIFKKEEEQVPPLPPIVKKVQPSSYHQIGKGRLEYTFYFKILYCDYIDTDTLKIPISKRITHLKKPFISYTFLTDYSLIPIASINQKQQQNKCYYQLRGNLKDIQQWLNIKNSIELNYIIMDKYTKESFGKSAISLKNINHVQDKIVPIHHHLLGDLMANVTVRIGLMSGWHDYKEDDEEHVVEKKRSTTTITNSNMMEDWDMILQQTKKSRHLSQSSVPTLLTSSTTSSTKSSGHNNTHVPTIQYIQRPSFTKKSKYSTSSYSSYNK